ncbi:MAG TPA: hypothetical protein VGB98_14520 [Pyrinomonadaceae bacterium]
MRQKAHNPARLLLMASLFQVTLGCQLSLSSAGAENKPRPGTTPVAREARVDIPEDWVKVDAGGKVAFHLPPYVKDRGATGTESLYREYAGGGLEVSLDYKPFGFLAYEERERAFGSGFQEAMTEVDGRTAYIFRYAGKDSRGNRLHVSELFVGDLPNRQVTLHMRVSSPDAAQAEKAQLIFKTVSITRE